MLRSTPIDELHKKFWERVATREGKACWEWKGSTHDFGYGLVRFWINGKQERYAHRLSWYLHFGSLGDAFVLHECDNPTCCRPNHLFLGSHVENMADMRAKGRHPAGQRHPMAKLSTSQIEECRDRFQSGETLLSISRELGVSSATLHRAIYGKGWKGVGQPLTQTIFGRMGAGEAHRKAKLTEDDVRTARKKRADGSSVTDLAREYGIKKAGMSKLLLGHNWKHVT